MTIYGHAHGCDGWMSTPAGTAMDQQERSLGQDEYSSERCHAIALGSSLVSSEADWTDPKESEGRSDGCCSVLRGRAVPFLLLQVMGDPSISTVTTFKLAAGD
jgi:hypothetical protein